MLQFVCGKSGYGKTSYVQDCIAHDVQGGLKGTILLVPEQFSFVTGNAFLSFLGQEHYVNLEITDFTRMAQQVKEQYGGAAQPVLDKGGRAVLMSRALHTVQDFLILYTKNLNTPSMIRSMLQIHTELTCCDVPPGALREAAQQVNKPLLQNKLHDIALVMDAYSALLTDRFLDSAEELTRLYETLLKTDYLKGRKIYIDGFDGFTAQELKIIERMLIDAERVTMALPVDSLACAQPDFSPFANVRRTARQLMELAKKNYVKVLSPIKFCEPKRFHSENLKFLSAHFMENMAEIEKQPSDGSIQIYETKSIYDECDNACRLIKNMLRTKGYRCRDIAIIVRDLTAYQLPLENAFRAYDLPFFEDQRQPVDSQPLIHLIRCALRVINHSFQTDDLLGFAKTSLIGLSTEEISELENYVILWKINGKKWTQPFTNHPSGFAAAFSKKEQALLLKINQTREAIVDPLLHFKNRVLGGNGRAMCNGVFQLLTEVKASENLRRIATDLAAQNLSALAEEQDRIWNLVIEILDQIVMTIGEEPISLKEFESLFEIIVSFQDLGSIPQGLDTILVSTADRAIADRPKAVYLLGANEGVFPKVFSSTGLFNDSDRYTLEQLDVALFSDTGRLTLQEKWIVYSAVTLPGEKLVVSYCTADVKGSALQPSAIIDYLNATFIDLPFHTTEQISDLEKIEGKKAAFALLAARWKENSVFSNSLKQYFLGNAEYQDNVMAIERQTDSKPITFTDKNAAMALFRQDMLVSASRVEAYYHCPFLYFCKFGLGAKPRMTAEMDPMQTGTVMHYVLEKLLSTCGSDGLVALADTQRRELVNQLLEQYLDEEMGVADHSSKRFQYLFLRLQKTINLVVAHLVEEFAQSEFKTKAYELKIDREADIEPLLVPLPDGGTLAIRGSVDRVDVMEKNNQKYLRVVDYKSGIKEFSLSDVLYGLNMQMLIYLFCIGEMEDGSYAGMIPSGVLYMPVRRSVSSMPREATAEAVQTNAEKALKMKGLLLDNTESLLGMERELKGRFIPVKPGKDVSGSLVSAQQLGRLSDKIRQLLMQMGQALHAGEIAMAPVQGKNYEHTCEYCDYQSVCVSKLDKPQRVLADFSHTKALEVLEEGSERNA